jgi:alpha-N-acetylglucosaminidase
MKLAALGVCGGTSANKLVIDYGSERPGLSPNDAGSSALPRYPAVSSQDLALSSARALLNRLLGARADEVDLGWIAPVDDHQVYDVTASGGRVSIKGSSGVAIARAMYTYLRETCNAMVTWSGAHFALPQRFPDCAPRRTVCPYQFTQYYNVCTFGYSTPFWDWNRWQRELDWMALHGITMPLALVGQEAIWQRVWKSIGITQSELDRFATAPAYLPWHWMGNLNRFEGPLPQGWIGQQMELQKMILGRMRELGITPIVPAFSGFIPIGFERVYPEAKTFTLLWSMDQPKDTKTFILHPSEGGLYKEIGRRFIQEYKAEFGPVEYYLADLFNELVPPVSADHRSEDLAQFGQAVYNGILAGDPNGKWVMQGWLFVDDPKFWDRQSAETFLSKIPDDRMIVIDYTGDLDSQVKHPVWKAYDAFFGKQWMNGMLPTLGGNNNVKGNLPLIATQPIEVLTSPDKGKLAGWAICPEGIENNEVVYELMTDVGWSEKKIDLQTWIPAYCRARYGDYPPAMREAWGLLLQSVYGAGSLSSRYGWQGRPSLEPSAIGLDSGPQFQQAVEHFLSCAHQLLQSELYKNDLIELVAQAAGGSVDRHLRAAGQAHKAGQVEVRDRLAEESLEMLLRIDGLMHLRPDRRLKRWIDAARSWAISPDEVEYYDSNARLIITFWGWSELSDYASRVWAGLIRDYYVGRWRAFFQSLRADDSASQAYKLDVWEQAWLSSPYVPSTPRPVRNLVTEARDMLDTCKAWESSRVKEKSES